MATSQRSRRRSDSSRSRGPRYIEPVLDPTWENPYTPSAAEREGHLGATKKFLMGQQRGLLVGGAALTVLLLVAGILVSPVIGILAAVVVAGLTAWLVQRNVRAGDAKGAVLGDAMLAAFKPGGSPVERKRLITVLDRLAATFGVDGISAFIVADDGYNAALVPNGSTMALFVTSAVMQDFELIELEGVVAHLLARHRLGVIGRTAASASLTLSDAKRRELAGPGVAYRADEVAAAGIHYPLGLANALRKCARQVVTPTSFFATTTYNEWRYTFFDFFSDRRENDLGDLDDVELRALALEEW